jgi:hypothetical protein
VERRGTLYASFLSFGCAIGDKERVETREVHRFRHVSTSQACTRKERTVDSKDNDLLSRYLWFSDKSCEVNKALSALQHCVEAAYSDDPKATKLLFRVNDLNLFLLQFLAFDGFVTACLHRRGGGRQAKEGSATKRLRRLASRELQADLTYQELESAVKEIEKVRDAWVHGQGDPAILKNPNWPDHFKDRFGIYEEDDRMWVGLSHDNGRVWSYVINTLHDMAKLIWESIR